LTYKTPFGILNPRKSKFLSIYQSILTAIDAAIYSVPRYLQSRENCPEESWL